MEINEFLNHNKIDYEANASMKEKTWIHRGGVASFYVKPDTIDKLRDFICFLYAKNIDFEIVGHTSNLYIKNQYNPFVVVSVKRLNGYYIKDGFIIAECGVNVSRLSSFCIEQGFAGFEGLISLPGTLGAAVYNNSSCYGCAISKMLDKIEIILPNGSVILLSVDDLHYSFRTSDLKKKLIRGVILRVWMKTKLADNITVVRERAIYVKRHRLKTQEGPKNNLGSIYSLTEYKRLDMQHISYLKRIKIVFYLMFIKALRLLGFSSERINHLRRNMLLYYSDCLFLESYVSKKNINCFIWRDDEADEMFAKYSAMMQKLCKKLEMEIEIKNGNC